jgi:hypothetical protein
VSHTRTPVFPPDLKKRKYLTVRGYSSDQILLAGDMSEGVFVEESIDRLFENSSIRYLHIGDATTGCYFPKVERRSVIEEPIAEPVSPGSV